MPEALTCWDKLEPGRVSSPCRGRWRRAQRADGGGVSAETLHVVTHDRRVGVTPLSLAALGYSPLEEVSLYPDSADFRQQNLWSAAC